MLDQATQHHPERHMVTVGNAVKAMVLNGLGFVNQQLSLVPMFCHNKPTPRLLGPGSEATHLNEETLGRVLDRLDEAGVTALSRLIAVTAAQRLGLTPTFAHLESTSLHVDGRDNRAEEPDAHVLHRTRGDSRDHRPDLNHVRLDWIVAPQAGIPLLMNPLRGHTSAASDFGQVVSQPLPPLHRASGTTSLGADRALYRAEHLQRLAHTKRTWITRVPATLTAAQAALAEAHPETMAPRLEGSRSHVLASTYGGVAPRGGRISSEQRQPQAQRPVDKPRRPRRPDELKAFQNLCRTALACEAEAQQALTAFAPGWHVTTLPEVTIRALPRDRKRGRPAQGAPPAQVWYQLEGALASSLATREALVAQQSGFSLATNERDDAS